MQDSSSFQSPPRQQQQQQQYAPQQHQGHAQQQQQQHDGSFDAQFDLMKRSFDNVNLSSGVPGASDHAQQNGSNSAGATPNLDGSAAFGSGADKKARYNTVPGMGIHMGVTSSSDVGQQQQQQQQQSPQQFNLASFNPGMGILGAPDLLSKSTSGNAQQPYGGVPGFPDYSSYASLSSQPNGYGQTQPGSPTGPFGLGSSTAAFNLNQQHQRQQSFGQSVSGHQRTPSTLSTFATSQEQSSPAAFNLTSSFNGSPQFGLVGVPSREQSSLQNSASPNLATLQQQYASSLASSPFTNAQLSSFLNANNGNGSASSASSLSGLGSLPGTTGLGFNSAFSAPGLSNSLSPAQSYSAAFAGSPALGVAQAQALLSASQNLGMSGMMGLGGLGMPNLGGLGMNLPMAGSPALSSALSPQMANLSWLDGNSPLAQWSSQMGGNDANTAAAAAAAALMASTNGYGGPSAMSMAMNQSLSGNGSYEGPETIRTVYVGNLPGDASVDELLSLVRYGPIEAVKIIPDKSCAFISFLDPNIAAAFHSDACLRKIALHGQELKIGWGKPTAIPTLVLQAAQNLGATRNVYLGNLDDSFTEQSLRDDLSRYGHIDQVKIVRDKNIGFVHFLSIATAMKVVNELPKEPEWHGKRVNYGKDRCAYVPRNQHQQQQHNQMAAAMAQHTAAQLTPFNPLSPAPLSPSLSPMPFSGGFVDPNVQAGNRCIYLGNLHPDTTCEDICNTIRGGIIESIKLIPEKHICFIHFVMPESAFTLHQMVHTQGLMVRNRRLKVGWGKPSGPCPPGIAAIVAAGGSRNVYIGNIDDFDNLTVERIRSDLSEYGEIEQVNALVEKSCAFTNYTNIKYAVKAIEALKRHPEYSKFKIAYGKDRVGNMARQPMNRRYNNQRSERHRGGGDHSHHHQYNGQGNGNMLNQSIMSSPGPDFGASSAHLAPGDAAGSHLLSRSMGPSLSGSSALSPSPSSLSVPGSAHEGGPSTAASSAEHGRALSPQTSAASSAAAAVKSQEQRQGLA